MTGNSSKVAQLRAQEEQRRLSREDLLSVHRVEQVHEVPDLGGVVVLQSLTHRERQKLRDETKAGTPEYDEGLMEVLSIVASLKEPKLTQEDVEALRDQDSTIIDGLVMEITFLNMSGRKDLGKESSQTQNSDSASD